MALVNFIKFYRSTSIFVSHCKIFVYFASIYRKLYIYEGNNIVQRVKISNNIALGHTWTSLLVYVCRRHRHRYFKNYIVTFLYET